MTISAELKKMYGEATNEEKNEAWNVYGCTDRHYRDIVNNKNTAGKPFKEDVILLALNALKQAKKNVAKKMYEAAFGVKVNDPQTL